MKKIISTLCILLTCHLFYAQSAGNYLYNNPYSVNSERANINVNTPNGSGINLKAQVMMNVRPSSYTAIFSAAQTGRDIAEVDSMMMARIDYVRAALAMMGIPETDIHIDAVAMVPTYAYKLEEKKFSKHSTEIPTGFEMKKNIHVLFRSHDLLDRIISEMAYAEIYDLVKVEYNIDGVQTYYEQLRKEALDVITQKEGTYNALKMHLVVYSLADGFNSSYPAERYKSYTAFNSGSSYQQVTYAKQLEASTNVYVEGRNNTVKLDPYGAMREPMPKEFVIQTAEKNKTIFYDRMPYNQFDKVINADTEEPCIQLYYELEVFYTMMTEEQFRINEEAKAAEKKRLEENARNCEEKGRRRRK